MEREKAAALCYVFLHCISQEREKRISRRKFSLVESKQN